MTQRMDCRGLGDSVTIEMRHLSRAAASHFTAIFDGIGELKTREGRALVVDAGPGTEFHTLYRARVFQSDGKLEAALGRPDIHLGSPRAPLAAAGRVNTHATSAFYGTNNQQAAIAEVRPPVGSRIAVARFEIIRRLRLLDLTVLSDIGLTEGLADFAPAGKVEVGLFLRSLSRLMTRPVVHDDAPFDDLATPAIVDFLATEASAQIDGIIFPSVQAAGDALNIVLFHKAARLKPMNVREGTEISASAGRWAEHGWVEECEVLEPPSHREAEKNEQGLERPDLAAIAEAMPLDPGDADWRDDSLRIIPESVAVHRVKRVEFATDEFTMKRHRREKRDGIDF